MRKPLRPVAPSLGDAAGRPRNGPHSKGPELPPSQETGEVRSRAIHFDRTGQPSTPAREGAEDKMNTTLLRAAFLFFAVSVISSSSQAQSNSSEAHLSGHVTDASGYTITGVRITAQSENAASSAASTFTAADGAFTLILSPGRYRIRLERNAFVPREFSLSLAAADARTLQVRLEIGQTPAPVDVLTPEEIHQRQLVSLADALATLPGAAIARTGREGGLTTFFLDGGNSNFTKF